MRTAFVLLTLLAACATSDPHEEAIEARKDTWPYYHRQALDARAPYARPVGKQELAERIERSFYARVPAPMRRSPEELRAGIAAALNIDYLLDGLEDRPFTVTVESVEDHGAYTWHRVVLDDPYIVGLTVDYLVPNGQAALRPGIVGLHGHYDDGPIFLERYLGTELAEQGYVVAAPTFRHMACGDDERNQAIALMSDGFTLMGQRVYEALLTMKLLRSLEGVDPERIGLAGHSGGSSTANLLVRLSDWPAAVLTDYEVEFRNTCGGKVHCETLPAMLPLVADVNDQDTLEIPHLRIDYGYRVLGQRQAALELFAATLRY